MNRAREANFPSAAGSRSDKIKIGRCSVRALVASGGDRAQASSKPSASSATRSQLRVRVEGAETANHRLFDTRAAFPGNGALSGSLMLRWAPHCFGLSGRSGFRVEGPPISLARVL